MPDFKIKRINGKLVVRSGSVWGSTVFSKCSSVRHILPNLFEFEVDWLFKYSHFSLTQSKDSLSTKLWFRLWPTLLWFESEINFNSTYTQFSIAQYQWPDCSEHALDGTCSVRQANSAASVRRKYQLGRFKISISILIIISLTSKSNLSFLMIRTRKESMYI